jgi:serine/threonine-protein kinase
MADQEIRQVGQYKLRDILGRGGMATVYRAYQANLDREVAVKVMSSQFVEDEAFAQRFKREARSIAALHHPNILNIYDFGEENGVPYIVTELIEGKTLRERMGQSLDLKQTAHILTQLASALDYAHERGIVHRDVKPSNVLMGNRDRAVLSDFGIVKLLEDTSSNLTATGFGVGTPEYMSPEQSTGDKIDGRSDLYSLGIMLYEMLTGLTPFRADTPIAIVMGHITKPLPDPHQYNAALTPQLVAVLNTALAKIPAERYQSGAAFASAFEAAIANPTPVITANPIVATSTPAPASEKTQVREVTVDPDATVALEANLEATTALPTGTAANLQKMATTLSMSAPEAYMQALYQEQQGNYQAAYETLVDVQQHEPNYRDVPNRVQRYEQDNYHYTGQFSLYNNLNTPNISGLTPLPEGTLGFATPPRAGSNSSQSQTATLTTKANGDITLTPPPAYVVASMNTSQPTGKTSQSKPNLALIGGVAAGVVVLVVALVVVINLTGSPTPTPTPTVQAVVPATAVVTNISTTATTLSNTNGNTNTAPSAKTSLPVATTAPTNPANTTTPTISDLATTQVRAVATKLYSSTGDLKGAVQQLKALSKLFPQNALAELELGQALYLWNHEGGEVEALQAATKLEPQNAKAWAILALAYRDNYQPTKALDAASHAVELDRNSADAHAAYALTLDTADSIDRAKNELNLALKFSPDGLWTLWAAFSINLGTGDNDNGLGYIEQLIKFYPTMATFLSAKGDYYSQLGKNEDAITWYKKTLEVDPDYAYAQGGLGWAYFEGGQFEQAKVIFQKAIANNDNYPYAHDGYGYLLINTGGYDEALKQFARSIIINPQDSLAYNGTSFAYISKALANKDPQAANDLFNQSIISAKTAIQYNANYADAYYHAGQAYFYLKDYPNAEQQLKQATTIGTTIDDYHALLAVTYYNEKKLAEAKAELDKTLTLNPANQQAKDLQAKLGN